MQRCHAPSSSIVRIFRKISRSFFGLFDAGINMPMMDGLKLIEAIRNHPSHPTCPIVVISTEGAEEDKARALKTGASAYLVKPVQARMVVQTVKGLLKLQ